MEFWRWYLSIVKKFFLLRWFKVKHPLLEYIIGIFLLAGLSIGLSVSLSPWWLFLTIPVGLTIAMHGLWRWKAETK